MSGGVALGNFQQCLLGYLNELLLGLGAQSLRLCACDLCAYLVVCLPFGS
jgi:hypothetical protein